MTPDHIAFIPDGNRRWGRGRGLAANASHRRGAERFRSVFLHAVDRGIPSVTFWMTSEDNLKKRSRTEISFLFRLLANEISSRSFRKEMTAHGVSVRFPGTEHIRKQHPALARAMRRIEEHTASGSDHFLTILVGYDGRSEMVDAVRRLIDTPRTKIDRATLGAALWTGFLPPVDLVVRTGEEDAGWSHQSSGFMMWQTANAEYYATKTLWPDFSPEEFDRVLFDYGRRTRRFGT
jgi:undecaprenyl diphosphate synthase